MKEFLTGIATFHGSIVAQEATDTKKFKSAGMIPQIETIMKEVA